MKERVKNSLTLEFLLLAAVTVGGWLYQYATLNAHFDDIKTRVDKVESKVDSIETLLIKDAK